VNGLTAASMDAHLSSDWGSSVNNLFDSDT
jgi:hypothetical protein